MGQRTDTHGYFDKALPLDHDDEESMEILITMVYTLTSEGNKKLHLDKKKCIPS